LFFLIEIQFRTKYEEHVRKSHLNLETKRNSEIMEQIAKSWKTRTYFYKRWEDQPRYMELNKNENWKVKFSSPWIL